MVDDICAEACLGGCIGGLRIFKTIFTHKLKVGMQGRVRLLCLDHS